MNGFDLSGEYIPLDHGDCHTIYTCGGGSNGAHRGKPVWGSGQLNGYSSIQAAVDDNAPGLQAAYGGDLQSSSSPSSIDINITVSAGNIGPIPLGGTIGVQIGTGGIAPYVGTAAGPELSASVTASPSSVNYGGYVTYGACFPVRPPFAACGGINSRGNKSAGVGIGFGDAAEARYGFHP